MRSVKTGSPDLPPAPLHPTVRVSIRSSNPLALIAAIRLALRRAGVDRDEIARFSDQALSTSDVERQLQVCRSWVWLDSRTEAGGLSRETAVSLDSHNVCLPCTCNPAC